MDLEDYKECVDPTDVLHPSHFWPESIASVNNFDEFIIEEFNKSLVAIGFDEYSIAKQEDVDELLKMHPHSILDIWRHFMSVSSGSCDFHTAHKFLLILLQYPFDISYTDIYFITQANNFSLDYKYSLLYSILSCHISKSSPFYEPIWHQAFLVFDDTFQNKYLKFYLSSLYLYITEDLCHDELLFLLSLDFVYKTNNLLLHRPSLGYPSEKIIFQLFSLAISNDVNSQKFVHYINHIDLDNSIPLDFGNEAQFIRLIIHLASEEIFTGLSFLTFENIAETYCNFDTTIILLGIYKIFHNTYFLSKITAGDDLIYFVKKLIKNVDTLKDDSIIHTLLIFQELKRVSLIDELPQEISHLFSSMLEHIEQTNNSPLIHHLTSSL